MTAGWWFILFGAEGFLLLVLYLVGSRLQKRQKQREQQEESEKAPEIDAPVSTYHPGPFIPFPPSLGHATGLAAEARQKSGSYKTAPGARK